MPERIKPQNINESQANPRGEEELYVLQHEINEKDGRLEELPPPAQENVEVLPGVGKGGEVLTLKEREELDQYAKEAEEKRKQWEKEKDPTLLGRFIEKVVGNRFMRVLIPAILIHGFSLSAGGKEDVGNRTAQKVEMKITGDEEESTSYDVDLGIKFSTKDIKLKTVQEGETHSLVRENETSKMMIGAPEKVQMEWARSYEVKDMEESEVKDLTDKIDKILDKFLLDNHLNSGDLKELKDQGVKNELAVSGLASPEGDEVKNNKVKESREKLARELLQKRLEERGLSDYFVVVSDTKDGNGAFINGEWQDQKSVFENLKKVFNVDSGKDLLDLIKKYNRGKLSAGDMSAEQTKLMQEIFDDNRGAQIQFRGGVIDRTADMDIKKDSDTIEEIGIKVPTIDVDLDITKVKNKSRPLPLPVPLPVPNSSPKPRELIQADKGILKDPNFVIDPQIYVERPLGKKEENNIIKEKTPEPISPEPVPVLPPEPLPLIKPLPREDVTVSSRAGLREIQSMKRGRLGKKELESVATGTGHGKGKERPKSYHRGKAEFDNSGEVASPDQYPSESSRSPKSEIKHARDMRDKEISKERNAERKFVRDKKENN